jgi:hypothetical protein
MCRGSTRNLRGEIEMDWTLAIAAGSLEIVILSSAIGVVWKLTRTEISLRGEFTKECAMIRAEAAKEVATLQAKVYQVEIWSRDEFVRKGSFEMVVARLEKTMELMGTKIETAVDKMATKVDSLQHQQAQQHHS